MTLTIKVLALLVMLTVIEARKLQRKDGSPLREEVKKTQVKLRGEEVLTNQNPASHLTKLY